MENLKTTGVLSESQKEKREESIDKFLTIYSKFLKSDVYVKIGDNKMKNKLKEYMDDKDRKYYL